MFTFPMLAMFVGLGVTGWAVYFAAVAVAAGKAAHAELRANRLELVDARLRAADEEAARVTAVRMLDELQQIRKAETQAFGVRLEVLERKYNTVLDLYRASIAIDGPMASRRVQ
jgi:hypothetical protein